MKARRVGGKIALRQKYQGTQGQIALIFTLMRFLILSMWLVLPAIMPAGADFTQSDPVKRWINHQCSVGSVTAVFVQERHLKALKHPIVNQGKLWFKAPGFFRWELGSPAESIAINRDGDLHLLRPLKKTGDRFSRDNTKKHSRSSAIHFLDIGFPESHKAFTEKFTVTSMTLKEGDYIFAAKVNDLRTNLALRKVVFQVDAETLITRSITLRFRDSSSVNTEFSGIRENIKLRDSIFDIDLTGYTITDNE